MPNNVIRRLTVEEIRPSFDWKDNDLNEFFAIDSIANGKELLAVTYVFEADDQIRAFFSLSNDAVKKEDVTRSKFKKLTKFIPRAKRYSTLPAVKIGRLATHFECQSQGIGGEILDFIKFWFTESNKTGCRFIIVDAYNNEKTIKFYEKNGFSFLLSNDEKQDTRLMIFDLKTVQQ